MICRSANYKIQYGTTVNWTYEEDEKLRQAICLHGGKKWNAINGELTGKTPAQCCERWRELQNLGTALKQPWQMHEDAQLCELVEHFGARKWAVIASYIPGRTSKQCRERWHNQLNPAISKAPWTVEEEEIIVAMQTKYGNRWAKITEKLRGRTDNAVKNHWHSSMKPRLKRMAVDTGSTTNDRPVKRNRQMLSTHTSEKTMEEIGGQLAAALSGWPKNDDHFALLAGDTADTSDDDLLRVAMDWSHFDQLFGDMSVLACTFDAHIFETDPVL